MSNIVLKDTGYVKTDNSGSIYATKTVATTTQKQKGEFIANDGSEVTINVEEVTYSRGANLDDNPNPGRFENTEINYASIENPFITIRGEVQRTNTTDMNKLLMFDDLVRTKGYKELYYNNATIAAYREITNSIGDTDTENTTYKHLHVRVKSFKVVHQPTSQTLRFTLNCQVTA